MLKGEIKMYNKHTNTKIEYQVVVDNKVCIAFNTDKKRKAFIARLKGTREITSISNVEYPWNPNDGLHNLVSPQEFAEEWGVDVAKVMRSIRNGKLQVEKLGKQDYIVNVHGYYRTKRGGYVCKED